jgi:hypothetical protein
MTIQSRIRSCQVLREFPNQHYLKLRQRYLAFLACIKLSERHYELLLLSKYLQIVLVTLYSVQINLARNFSLIKYPINYCLFFTMPSS